MVDLVVDHLENSKVSTVNWFCTVGGLVLYPILKLQKYFQNFLTFSNLQKTRSNWQLIQDQPSLPLIIELIHLIGRMTWLLIQKPQTHKRIDTCLWKNIKKFVGIKSTCISPNKYTKCNLNTFGHFNEI